MSSPLTTWEGAEAIFTFADKPGVMMFILVVAVVVTIYAIVATFKHENESYIDYQD
jgi:uncharacterized membrane protein